MSFRTKLFLFLCLMLWAVVPAFAQRNTTEGMIDVMKDTDGLSHFAELVEDLGIADRYNNTDVFYTAFALQDDTADALLADLGYDSVDDMSDTDKLTLSVIVTYHFLPGAYNQATLEAIQGVVDGPVSLASALPGTILTYEDGKIDDVSEITDFDLPGSNGYIHIIDNYLVPTKDAFERSIDVITSDAELTKDQSEQATLAKNLQDAADFSMITEAIEKVGLTDDLEGQGPYTLFVMTDETLTRVLDSADIEWEDLLADDQGLTNLLMYHILSGQYSSAALKEYDKTFVGTMLAHTVVGMSVDRDEISVNDIPLVVTDVVASNGIIHVIDGVLLPPSGE